MFTPSDMAEAVRAHSRTPLKRRSPRYPLYLIAVASAASAVTLLAHIAG